MPTEIILLSIITFISIINILLLIKLHRKSDTTEELEDTIREEFIRNRTELIGNLSLNRTENTKQFNVFQESMLNRINTTENAQRMNYDAFLKEQKEISNLINLNLKEIRDTSDKKMSTVIELNSTNAQYMREDMQTFMKNTETKLNAIKENVDTNLKSMQTNNAEQIEKMRQTVDEKLHNTLETRLTESFRLVSDKLETVQKGLGEMHTLATGVGDLKKVLSNVKTKGVLGEYQLENILEEILTQTQYEKNINTIPDSNDRVEFAIKMPGKEDEDSCVYLPIDAKFPTEDYHNLLNAYDTADADKIQQSKKSLEQKLKKFAKDIRQKYISVPDTTDFGILFLPFEGLYAEVLRLDGLFETLQRQERIIITGPTTIAAFLNSLQIGFRTLAIQKRSSEVWEVLGAVKTEFGKFARVLEKTKKKLETATREIDNAGVRTRAIERQLRDVQALPESEDVEILGELEESQEQ
ncbi:MAG: DNA recombination protein RmuC [Thermotogota bacterium]